ncbi:hypothetical protein [Celeribacter sp.]|uniref:hypothetical protein n=1 Tax=Celeribacter sp. TaxID=1890673 RepID=UPI003A8DC9B4
MSSIQQLNLAFSNAVNQFEKTTGDCRTIIPRYVCSKTTDFVATIEPKGNGYVLSLSSGLAEKSSQLWAEVFTNVGLLENVFAKAFLNADQMTQASLVWLILHEFHHIDLKHFELARSFDVAQRSRAGSPQKFLNISRLCLEMQADHEATEMLLGAYSPDNWQDLREKVLAISGMMMLIELEDSQNGAKGRTHPKAATRIFQLLGHLAEMPLVQAQIIQDASLIPSQDELQAFAHDVTIPCFFDAIELAQIARAVSIADDLGTLEDFFKDLEIAKLRDPSRYKGLKTQGAQEWAKLWPYNEALKPILGGDFDR